MNMTDSVMMKLHDTFIHVEFTGSLDQCLGDLSSMAENLLGAKECSIEFLSETEIQKIGLLPMSAFGKMSRFGHEKNVIYEREASESFNLSGSYIATQKTSIAAGVEHGESMKNRMFSTIVLQKKIVGVIHAHQPQQKKIFTDDDLYLFGIIAHLIAKSIQVIQMQNILNSRFAQIALTKSHDKTIGEIVLGSAQNPNHIARILAKSFYREMTSAGFTFNQIIYAASEVISELSSNLRKHSAGRKHRAGITEKQKAPSAQSADCGPM